MNKSLASGYLLFISCLTGFVMTASAGQHYPNSVQTAVLHQVVRAEITALRLSDRKDLCVDVSGKNPSGDLARRLRASGVLFHKGSWCTKGPRGIGIQIRSVTLADNSRAEVEVQTGDYNLREGEHFGTLLRRGTYVLERRPDGTWGIVDYKKA